MKLSDNQTGFTLVEGLLIFIIAAIIGGTGYYVYHSNHQVSKDLQSANTDAKFAQSKKEAKPAAKSVDDKTAILEAIKLKWGSQIENADSNCGADAFAYSVEEISGVNAYGRITNQASCGDPMMYVAHKDGANWTIVTINHLLFADKCVQYSLPSNWCISEQ